MKTAPSTQQVFLDNGNALTAAMIVWAHARLTRTPLTGSYNDALDALDKSFGSESVLEALKTFRHDDYLKQGWEAAL